MTDLSKISKLAVELEARGFDAESFKLAQVARDITAAPVKESDVEVTSWLDFLNWFNSNRGQALAYIFVDTYGENSPEAQTIAQLLEESNKLEADLHAFYMTLRNKAMQPAGGQVVAPPAAQAVDTPPPAPADQAAPAADTDLDDLDLESTGDEEDEEA